MEGLQIVKNNQEDFYPAALTVSGSDPSGGSGIQADLRSFNAAGVFGCSVITAVTAQNPGNIDRITAMPPELVEAQFDSVMSAVAVRAVKVGMLADSSVVRSVIRFLKKKRLPLVVDLVIFSAAGKQLLDAEGMQLLKDELLPLADLITPGIREAEWLLARKLTCQDDHIKAAAELAENYKCNVLLNTASANVSGNQVGDIAVIGGKSYLLAVPRIGDLSEYAVHGMSCTFSSAVTAMLAVGNNWKDALCSAKAHVYGSLCETALIGRELEAMYPPLEDYSRFVSLRSLNSAPGRKERKNAR